MIIKQHPIVKWRLHKPDTIQVTEDTLIITITRWLGAFDTVHILPRKDVKIYRKSPGLIGLLTKTRSFVISSDETKITIKWFNKNLTDYV